MSIPPVAAYSGASSSWANLVADAINAMETRVGYEATRAATQAIGASASAVIDWDTVVANAGFVETAGSIVVPEDGIYLMDITLTVSSGSPNHIVQLTGFPGGTRNRPAAYSGTAIGGSTSGALTAGAAVGATLANGLASGITVTGRITLTKVSP